MHLFDEHVAVKREFKVRVFMDTCTFHNADLAPEVIQNYLRAADLFPMFGQGRRITHAECNDLVSFSKMVDLEIRLEVIGQEYRDWLRSRYKGMF